MTPGQEELESYMFGPPAGQSSTLRLSRRARRLAAAILAAVMIWVGVAAILTSNASPSVPAAAGPPQVSDRQRSLGQEGLVEAASPATPQPAVSPLSAGPAEYLTASLPTARSAYMPRYGTRYDPAAGTFGPVDATVTRKGPGDYTVDFPNLADARDVVDVRAGDSRSICYSAEGKPVGANQEIRVECLRLVSMVPTLTTPTDSRFTIAIIQPAHP